MDLSSQQKVAVEHIGTPALVVAGAGSGKTRTLTAKIEYLLSKGYDPKRILAITFTNKAAEEMKKRLVELTGMSVLNFPWVRTYHSACYTILKEYCTRLGYTPPLQIFSQYHQTKMVKEIAAQLNIDKKLVPQIISDISKAKNYGNPQEYFNKKKKIVRFMIKDVYDVYENKLKENNAVDFDNILLLVRNLLRDDAEVRNKYQELFQYILVDEYQDSNNLQEELTGLLLGHGNLFCVGDDWQAVYGFRGSNVNHFLSFKNKYSQSRIFRLEENYRSANEIVQLANQLIDNNSQRMEKKCFSEKKGGIVEINSFYNETEEASWVARKLMTLNNMGIRYDDMAVIYRTKALSLPFEKVFRAYKIPYQMKGSKGFFERKEVLDINCYLSAAVFPKDDVSFERIINTPKRGIGPAMIKKIAGLKTDDTSLQDAARRILSERVLSAKVHDALKKLMEGLDEISGMPPKEAVNEILFGFQYKDYLKSTSKSGRMEFSNRMENIEQLLYSASLYDNIVDYLEDASLIKEDKDDEDEDSSGGVSLSTVHASKGLEYISVFVAGCEESIFPHWKSMESEKELQEERRLMYVALTRAEAYLYLCASEFRRGQVTQKSRFLYEIEESLN